MKTSKYSLPEQALVYFEQAKLLNQSTESTAEKKLCRQKAKQLQSLLLLLAKELATQLRSIRTDLEPQLQSLKGNKLPETLSLFIRKQKTAQTSARLYVTLREEGFELGFGFFRERNTKISDHEKHLFKQLQRHHHKSKRYLQALQANDYKLWPCSKRPWNTPTQMIEEWRQNGGVAVRLIPYHEALVNIEQLSSFLGQIFGELIGFFSFIDRVQTNLPHIRTLQTRSPQDSTFSLETDDLEQVQEAASEWLLHFLTELARNSFLFPPELLKTYYLSLQTRPFVILTGLAGTGKTKLAQMFARFLSSDLESPQGNPHLLIVPIRPDWLDPQGLLGYFDSLSGVYRATPFLQLILRALQDPQNPYFAILDEMNLARVEYYFSDFLSIMESRIYDQQGKIISQGFLQLHNEPASLHIPDIWHQQLQVPAQIPIPQNLYITGTANLDETTYRLSPKVLDRANVIEIQQLSPTRYLQGFYQEKKSSHPRNLAEKSRQRVAFLKHGNYTAPHKFQQLTLPPEMLAELASFLDFIQQLLQQAGFGFGARLIQEVLDFTENFYRQLEPKEQSLDWVLDRQMLQKILPRLHGTRQRLEPLLQKLLLFCWKENRQEEKMQALLQSHAHTQKVEKALQWEQNQSEQKKPSLQHSAKKITGMLKEFQFESYIDFYMQR